ncbi:MAG: hypothetical protein ABJF05_14725 [Paracoccaceae bacterium]
MHKIADWASFNSTDILTIQTIIHALAIGELSEKPKEFEATPHPEEDVGFDTSRKGAYNEWIIPALSNTMDPVGDFDLAAQLNTVTFQENDPETSGGPFAYLDTATDRPTISMIWSGEVADLMCLAHETGHAAQIILSGTDKMPPVARETCGFIAELALIAHLQKHNQPLHQAALAVWFEENKSYLGTDVVSLTDALKDPGTAYQYRFNYPIARLAAVRVFDARETGRVLTDLFASGAAGMDHVPLEELAVRGDAIKNYLPPLQNNGASTLAAYQALGAMALLDIDTYKGVSEHTIEEYYAEKLRHLQQQTAFVCLSDDSKPLGYATWKPAPLTSSIEITRQTAPFGDHLKLQRTLHQKFGEGARVTARHNRSARPEQDAW